MSSELTILIGGEIRPSLPEEVLAIVPRATVHVVRTQAELHDRIASADIVVSTVLPRDSLRQATRLKWVQSWAAGPDQLMYDEMRRSAVLVTSCKGNGAIPLAEHAMMLMLMLDRDARRALKAQDESRWDRFYHGELNGRTIGIVGAGNSGADLALKAKAFHMRVLGMRRSLAPAASFDRFYRREALHEFLAECDFLVVTAPLTNETRGMLGEPEFRAMKPTAFYICYSRGEVAETAALERALREGWIAGAGLDAHEDEPLSPQSPFWSMPNVIVTAHNGALSAHTRRRGYDIFLENLRRFAAGDDMINIVDKQTGY